MGRRREAVESEGVSVLVVCGSEGWYLDRVYGVRVSVRVRECECEG